MKTITTKKTNTSYLFTQLLSDFVLIAIGIFCAQKIEPLRNSWQFSAAETMVIASIFFFIFAFLSIVYHAMAASTVAEVCNETITGRGLQGISVKSFQLPFHQISGLSSSKGFLNIETGNGVFLIINTTSGNYKIVTSPKRADEIITLFNSVQK